MVYMISLKSKKEEINFKMEINENHCTDCIVKSICKNKIKNILDNSFSISIVEVEDKLKCSLLKSYINSLYDHQKLEVAIIESYKALIKISNHKTLINRLKYYEREYNIHN